MDCWISAVPDSSAVIRNVKSIRVVSDTDTKALFCRPLGRLGYFRIELKCSLSRYPERALAKLFLDRDCEPRLAAAIRANKDARFARDKLNLQLGTRYRERFWQRQNGSPIKQFEDTTRFSFASAIPAMDVRSVLVGLAALTLASIPTHGTDAGETRRTAVQIGHPPTAMVEVLATLRQASHPDDASGEALHHQSAVPMRPQNGWTNVG
jgi:hypothetical protein